MRQTKIKMAIETQRAPGVQVQCVYVNDFMRLGGKSTDLTLSCSESNANQQLISIRYGIAIDNLRN
jgi:hypothetical protein